MKENKGILNGIRVLDLTRMLSGPYCTMILADNGAEVIKIENSLGDTSRRAGPFRKDDKDKNWAGYFVSLNRNKKSIMLNLKSKVDQERFFELVKTAHILVENFRPGVMERLGISYETLSKINKKLVYGSIKGFGDPRLGESPYSTWPSYDVVAQAMGGIVSLTGINKKKPLKVGPGIGDIFTGSLLSFGLISALRNAEKKGEGQFVDVAMYDSMISLCERAIYQYSFSGNVPEPHGNRHPFLAPFGIYKVKDGHIALGIVEDNLWEKFLTIVGKRKLLKKNKFSNVENRSKNQKKVNKLVSKTLIKYTKKELTKILGGHVPFGPVNNFKEIINDLHLKKREMLVSIPHNDNQKQPWLVSGSPIKFSKTKQPIFKTAPKLGQHNNILFKKTTKNVIDLNFNQERFINFDYFLVYYFDSNKNLIYFFIDNLQFFKKSRRLIFFEITRKTRNISSIKDIDFFILNGFLSKQISKKNMYNLVKTKRNWIDKKGKVPHFTFSDEFFYFKKEKFLEIDKKLIVFAKLTKIDTMNILAENKN